MKKCSMLIPLTFFLLLLISCKQSQNNENKNPFDVTVNEVKIITDHSGINDETPAKRLVIDVSIKNAADKEFSNVNYKLSLNEEATPYIASQVLEFTQQQGIHILPKNKFDEYINKNEQLLDDDPIALGFDASWDMLLTTEEDLQEYHGLAPDGIYNSVKDLYVDIYWDGGEQHETVSLQIPSERH